MDAVPSASGFAEVHYDEAGRRREPILGVLPWLEPTGVSAGLHLVTWLPPHLDETAVVQALCREPLM